MRVLVVGDEPPAPTSPSSTGAFRVSPAPTWPAGLRMASDVPIVFVTVTHSAEAVHQAFRVGADDYITKPFARMIRTVRATGYLLHP